MDGTTLRDRKDGRALAEAFRQGCPIWRGPSGTLLRTVCAPLCMHVAHTKNETYENGDGEVLMTPKFQMRLSGQDRVLDVVFA